MKIWKKKNFSYDLYRTPIEDFHIIGHHSSSCCLCFGLRKYIEVAKSNYSIFMQEDCSCRVLSRSDEFNVLVVHAFVAILRAVKKLINDFVIFLFRMSLP